jgi:predicted RND superfamily exporter protein
MAVLYNNMLHSLYRSQILTLGLVFIAILLMFIILFRHLYQGCLKMPAKGRF